MNNFRTSSTSTRLPTSTGRGSRRESCMPRAPAHSVTLRSPRISPSTARSVEFVYSNYQMAERLQLIRSFAPYILCISVRNSSLFPFQLILSLGISNLPFCRLWCSQQWASGPRSPRAGPRSAASPVLPTRRGIPAASPSSSTPRRATGTSSGTTLPSSSSGNKTTMSGNCKIYHLWKSFLFRCIFCLPTRLN